MYIRKPRANLIYIFFLCTHCQWVRRCAFCLQGAFSPTSRKSSGFAQHLKQRPSFSLCCGQRNTHFRHAQSGQHTASTPLSPSGLPQSLRLRLSVSRQASPSSLHAICSPVAKITKSSVITLKISSIVTLVMQCFFITHVTGNLEIIFVCVCLTFAYRLLCFFNLVFVLLSYVYA